MSLENTPTSAAADAARISELTPLQRAALAIKELRARLDAIEAAQREPIAIIGMDCRFPGADSLDAYWKLLSEGIDRIREVPPSRWDLERFFDPNPNADGKINTRYGGFLDDVAGFDAAFFGIAPREAERMDPQQRLLLEGAWHALEEAGIAPTSLRGSRTGVFVGMTQNDYGVMQLGGPVEDIQAYTGTGNGQCFAAGRIAYVLGLHGPTFTVDTACSSSMVALHQACQALRNKECDLAIVAGAQFNLTPPMQIFLSKTQSFAPDGRCRTFDEAANGFVLGEGIGVVVLRRKGDAQALGDSIHALVLATGVNHDGPSSGLTVPSEGAQEAVIRWTQTRAGLAPADIDYVEAHGTATQLGDPIEVGALRSVFRVRSEGEPLRLGSVKTNFGHLNACAGLAGLIKVVLMLEKEAIAPNLHFKTPSSRILWEGFSVRVPTALEPWRRGTRPRRGAVNSFGLSGTNTHTILEEAPVASAMIDPATPRPLQLFCLSARGEAALRDLVLAYLAAPSVAEGAEATLADLCLSANAGRSHFTDRLALCVADLAGLRAGLTTYLESGTGGVCVPRAGAGKLAWWLDDGILPSAVRALAGGQPQLDAGLAQCKAAYAASGGVGELADLPDPQPAARFAALYALAWLWWQWGPRPAALAGDGVGLLAARTLAGVYDLETAFRLLAGGTAAGRVAELSLYDGLGMALPFADLPTGPLGEASDARATALAAIAAAGYATVLVLGEHAENLPTGLAAPLTWAGQLAALASLYRRGFTPDWAAVAAGQGGRRVRLPGYVFQHERFWLERLSAPAPVISISPAPAISGQSGVITSAAPVPSQAGQPVALTSVEPTAVSASPASTSPVQAGEWSSLLGGQLDAVAEALNAVVSQQLDFLRRRGVVQPASAAEPVTTNSAIPDAMPEYPATSPPPLVVAAPQASPEPPPSRLGDWQLLRLAAADEAGLARLGDALVAQAERGDTLPDLTGEGGQRAMLVHRGGDDLRHALGETWSGRDAKRIIAVAMSPARPRRSVVFMFPGVGDHYLNMAQGLYWHEPVFRAAVDQCCDFLQAPMGVDLREVLYPAPTPKTETDAPVAPAAKLDFRAMLGRGAASADPAETRLNQTIHSQPLVFIIEYALGRTWLARGLRPEAMIGYSIGEYAAACLAEVVALEEALTLITRRAAMIQALPHGVMLAVPLAEEKLEPLLGNDLSLCIVSTPAMCVVGGPETAVAALEDRLKTAEIVSRRLPGTHAFHSHMLKSLHAPLTELIRGFSLAAPKIPYLSNVTGDWITHEEAVDPGYWARHTWQTVRFADGLNRLLDREGRVFVEAGPGQSLGSFVLQHPAAAKLADKLVLPSLRNRYERQDDEAFFLSTLGKLWLAGVETVSKT